MNDKKFLLTIVLYSILLLACDERERPVSIVEEIPAPYLLDIDLVEKVFLDFPLLSNIPIDSTPLPITFSGTNIALISYQQEKKNFVANYVLREKMISASSLLLYEEAVIELHIKSRYAHFWDLTHSVRKDSISSIVKKFLLEEPTLDPFSIYYPPYKAEIILSRYTQASSGSYIGIRLRIEQTGDTMVVIQVIEDSPANDAGMQKQDRIISVNGQSVIGVIGIAKYPALVVGDNGTVVTLQVLREDSIHTLVMTKREVVLSTVLWEQMDNHGYIRVFSFSSPTLTKNGRILNTNLELEMALDSTKNFPVTILDLRNNGGGLVDQVVAMVDQFLTEGKIATFIVRRVSSAQIPVIVVDKIIATSTSSIGTNRKFVLLVNSNSASASEIFISALNEGLNIPIVGEKTFGKAVGQRLIRTPLNGLFSLTIMKILSRNGNNYSGVGIIPTHPVTSNLALEKALLVADSLGGKDGALLKRSGRSYFEIINEVESSLVPRAIMQDSDLEF